MKLADIQLWLRINFLHAEAYTSVYKHRNIETNKNTHPGQSSCLQVYDMNG
jgi:hypothetical protein